MEKNKPALTAALCMGIAVIIFLVASTTELFFRINASILTCVLPFVFTIAAIVYVVQAMKFRRSIWNYAIAIVASVLSAVLLYFIIIHLLLYGLNMPDDPPWPDQDEEVY